MTAKGLATYDLIVRLVDEVSRLNPLQRGFLESSLSSMDSSEIVGLTAYLQYSSKAGIGIPYLAKSYDTIVKDTLREQMHFQRHRRYRYSSYKDVADIVYRNDAYMRLYMHGLALTAYLWPNHRDIHRFFLSSLPRGMAGRYLEIGPGHGLYFTSAMMHASFDSHEGIDISPTSIALTRDLLQSGCFGSFANYDLYCRDFLSDTMPDGAYDAVVMGEVLEHVEQPLEFLRKIRMVANDGAFIFVTTAINAPAIDHIYLFDSVGSVEDIVASAGFTIRDQLVVPYAGKTLDESLNNQLPINIAFVLSR